MVDANSILAILDVMFYWSIIIGMIGLLLSLRPIKRIANAVDDHEIFQYWLAATSVQIVVGAFVVLRKLEVEANLSEHLQFIEEFHPLGKIMPSSLLLTIDLLTPMWVVLIVSMYFLKVTYERIAKRTSTEMFRKAGRLYYYGALLSIVFVGFVLLLAAVVYQLLAHKSLPHPLSPLETPKDRVDGPRERTLSPGFDQKR
jgi:uncharacterized membrane protein